MRVPSLTRTSARILSVNGVGDMETTQVFCNTGTIGEMFDAAKRRLHVRLKVRPGVVTATQGRVGRRSPTVLLLLPQFHLPKRDHSRVEGAGLHAATRQVTGEAVLLFFPHVNGTRPHCCTRTHCYNMLCDMCLTSHGVRCEGGRVADSARHCR